MEKHRVLDIGHPTPKAMVLNNKYHVEYNHNLNRMLQDPELAELWESATNEERTYVLKGGRNIYGF